MRRYSTDTEKEIFDKLYKIHYVARVASLRYLLKFL